MQAVEYEHPEIERLERTELEALQRRKLRLLGERLAHSPEWRARFTAAGVDPERLDERDRFRALPMLEKRDLRDLYPFPFLTLPLSEVVRFVATSGTT
ncbi:MAG TPA: hypothetical protein VKG44_00165, partial [Candidatus Baltobacteraceae bacterium]|nr:hypothetical protein [Candidatus Baltobacteraceae bacterium]